MNIKPLSSGNTVWHTPTVSRAHRELSNGHKSAILWFTGLSGAGKSTLAHAVEERLNSIGVNTFVLDGDNVRHGLCSDLGFSDDDRTENIRRIGEIAKLFIDAGIITLTAFISPFRSDRKNVRDLVDRHDFIEVYCNATLMECERRDVKGLYKKARQGEIAQFTGLTSPYESPESPEIEIDTGKDSVEECVDIIVSYLQRNAILPYYHDRLSNAI